MLYPEPIERLVENLSRLPGIGRKTATRLAFFLLNSSKSYVTDLASSIAEMKERIQALQQLLQHHRRRPVRHMPGREASRSHPLRRRGALAHDGDRVRLPRRLPLPHSPRRDKPHRGDRARGDQDTGDEGAHRQGGHKGAYYRHQPDHRGQHDGPLHRWR